MELSFSFPLYGHDFFALCIHCRINFFDIFICALLDFLLKFFDFILRYILFCKFLKCIIRITTNVADCYFGCFAFFLDIFNQFLTAFLCKFREYKADYLPSLLGFNPRSEVRIAFSIPLIRLLSHGWIWIIRASGTVIFATC